MLRVPRRQCRPVRKHNPGNHRVAHLWWVAQPFDLLGAPFVFGFTKGAAFV
jgi:hypothetical protein